MATTKKPKSNAGRPALAFKEKKQRVQVYRHGADLVLLGGMEAARKIANQCLDNAVALKKKQKVA